MICKAVEIRDKNTFIPAVAIAMREGNAEQGYLLRRVGFRDGVGVVLMRLADQRATSDPHMWEALSMGTRTMQAAHWWLIQHFDDIEDGAVVDVEFIRGETGQPKVSEAVSWTAD